MKNQLVLCARREIQHKLVRELWAATEAKTRAASEDGYTSLAYIKARNHVKQIQDRLAHFSLTGRDPGVPVPSED
jgi:hypothetical protein